MIVWTADMNDLVTENSTLNLTDEGNLVIFNANGNGVWSTNTSGRGVVGFELRNDRNLVLYDENYKTVWQSFDHPTDSLLVAQSLNIGGVKKLVSRASEKDGSEGPYSLAVEARGLVLYLNLTEEWTLPFYERGPRDSDAIKHGCHHMIYLTLANITAHELCNLTSEETNTALYGFNTPRSKTNWSFLRLEPDRELKMYRYLQFDKGDITYLRSGCWQGLPQCDLAIKFGGSMVDSGRCLCVACAQAVGKECLSAILRENLEDQWLILEGVYVWSVLKLMASKDLGAAPRPPLLTLKTNHHATLLLVCINWRDLSISPVILEVQIQIQLGKQKPKSAGGNVLMIVIPAGHSCSGNSHLHACTPGSLGTEPTLCTSRRL